MRYGVLADVHGNLPALEVVLAALEREGVDAYLCAGDLVGWGPFPDECVERIAALDPVCVAGNHDLIALGTLSDERCGPLARETLRWTRSMIGAATREYLAALPLTANVGGQVVLAHGSLDDPQSYTRRDEQAKYQLERLAEESPDARILVLGHTHNAAAWSADGRRTKPSADPPVRVTSDQRWLLNPGAVGQSRDRLVRARFLILDLARNEAEFHALPYDVERCREALQRRGLPEQSVHLRPSLVRRLAAYAREAHRKVWRFRR
jgi:predicted phosphodiesterase